MNDCHALVLVVLPVCAYNYVDVCVQRNVKCARDKRVMRKSSVFARLEC